MVNPSVLFKPKTSQKIEADIIDKMGFQERRDSVEPFLKNECKWFHPMNNFDPKRNQAIDNRLTSKLIRCLTSKYNLIIPNLETKRFRRFISEELYRLFPNLNITQLKFMDKLSRSLRNKRLESRQ